MSGNGSANGAKNQRNLRTAVIGAGMSGILTGIKLQEAGYTDIVIYEKAGWLGGTWRDNTYPGLSCDIPSHLYRYSFEPNPNWSRLFSPGAEINEYLAHVAEKYNVMPLIQFNKDIVRCEYRDDQWHIESKDGTTDVADVVIAATGVLRDPVMPDIPGLDDFQGDKFHAARWNHDVSLAGRRVGIVGTGSTAIQIVTAIVGDVEHLSLFQRTAQWVFPQANPFYSEQDKENFRSSPEMMTHIFNRFADRIDNSFAAAVVGDDEQLKLIEQACMENLAKVKDPELRAALTPDYTVACKRLIMSDDFYDAIQQPNASLVTSHIERVEAGGVRTADGTLHELDVLVLATGFDGHRFIRPMQVIGRDGLTVDEAWEDATFAYKSVSIPEFPNFFMLLGPHSPIGNLCLIEVAEIQVKYVLQLMELIRDGRCREVVAKQEAVDQFAAEIKEAMKDTVWVTGCRSWYQDKHGTPAIWPWHVRKFRSDMQHPELQDFELIA